MKCKNHPKNEAEQFCASCGIPICRECIEEPVPGQYFCFQCAMLQTVSVVGTSLVDKREKAHEKRLTKKKGWGPFHYFVILSSVLILVMWGVILFGGKKAPGQKIDFATQERVFLFMVDSSIKRYAHYQGNKYPDRLADLVPKYIYLNDEDIPQLDRFKYIKDPATGYQLSMARPKAGEMNIILSPKGIKYEVLATGEAQK
jgi:hypothetical protein